MQIFLSFFLFWTDDASDLCTVPCRSRARSSQAQVNPAGLPKGPFV
jgi:hypothetical protein